MPERLQDRAPLSIAERLIHVSDTFKRAFNSPDLSLIEPHEVDGLTESEKAILDCCDWLVNPEYVAGAGLFQSGSIDDPRRESAIAAQMKASFEQGGAVVHPISIDTFLECEPTISIVRKIIHLSNDPSIGVQNEEGRPRAIIITGFSQSKYLTKEGLLWLQNLGNSQPVMAQMNIEAQKTIFPESSLSEGLRLINDPKERERMATFILGHAYSDGWQQLAKRKNSVAQNIMTISVMPQEALKPILAYLGGGQPDFLFRVREMLSNV